MKELDQIAKMADFKGYISDIGGSDLHLHDSCHTTRDDGVLAIGWKEVP
jgi:hypothetical protein